MRRRRWHFKVGDRVHKTIGDYTFSGVIVTRFVKWQRDLAGPQPGVGIKRYVVQNREGILHIFNEMTLDKVKPRKTK